MNDLFDRRHEEHRQQLQQEQEVRQLQQEQLYSMDSDESYLSARRAAVEAIEVGRATLEVTVQQGEQLDRVRSVGDETQYQLDKAARVLRGMTWSGWLANKFTSDAGVFKSPSRNIGSIDSDGQRQRNGRSPPLVYDLESLPSNTKEVAQALQNYHANVIVLEECETEEQKQTCQMICDSMFKVAHQTLTQLQQLSGMEAYALEFAKDFKVLRERQLNSQQQLRELDHITAGPLSHATVIQQSKDRCNGSPGDVSKSQCQGLFNTNELNRLYTKQNSITSSASLSHIPPSGGSDFHTRHVVLNKQDDHLNAIAQSLGELKYIAKSLSSEIGQQHETIDAIETQGDSLLESTRLVTRRAERMIQQQQSSWSIIPSGGSVGRLIFFCHVSIRHVSSGMYLSIDPNNKTSLVLTPLLHSQTCRFGIWKRRSGMAEKSASLLFGMKNSDTGKWAGQSLLGSLTCNATTFGRREEWEADCEGKSVMDFSSMSSPRTVRLLLASAGWGQGAYLITPNWNSESNCANKYYNILGLSGSSMEERKQADRWIITNIDTVDVSNNQD